MSRAAKLTLLTTSVVAAVIVVGVHYAQASDKAAMHVAVVQDIEKQRLKKERQADFDLQKKMEQEYRKVQTVSDGKG